MPALLTLRAAGDMRRDGPGRAAYYRSTGINPEDVWVVGQTHSRTAVVVSPPQTGARVADEVCPDQRTAIGEHFTPSADGMVTADPGLILGVTVADCMPIFLADPVTGARGLLHSGWRGTGILARAVQMMTERFGSRAGDLLVTMGPCISAESYEVDEQRALEFAREWGPAAVRRSASRVCLDLRAANQEICRRCGVSSVNVVEHCTAAESSLASYRRDGAGYTLMLALLGERLGEIN